MRSDGPGAARNDRLQTNPTRVEGAPAGRAKTGSSQESCRLAPGATPADAASPELWGCALAHAQERTRLHLVTRHCCCSEAYSTPQNRVDAYLWPKSSAAVARAHLLDCLAAGASSRSAPDVTVRVVMEVSPAETA